MLPVTFKKIALYQKMGWCSHGLVQLSEKLHINNEYYLDLSKTCSFIFKFAITNARLCLEGDKKVSGFIT